MVKIREAIFEDIPGIVDVAEDVFEAEYKKFRNHPRAISNADFFKENMGVSRNGIYVVEEGDEVVGFSYYVPNVRVGTILLE